MNFKLLTVIVPSYNMEAYLPKCLGSLVIDDRELFEGLDVIVVNDGSKDRTGEIAHEFEAKYPGVFRVIDKENGHYGSCINAALPMALGEFVKVLDADDSFASLGFEAFLRFLAVQAEDADLVVSDYDVVDAAGRVTDHVRHDYPVDRPFSVESLLGDGRDLTMHALAYRTEVLRKLRYRQLEGVSYTDTEWSLIPLAGVSRIRHCPSTVYLYLRGRDGQTVDAAQVARDFWMRGELALDMLRQFGQVRGLVAQETVKLFESRLWDLVEGVYKGGIIGFAGMHANIDLEAFDKRLCDEFPQVFNEMGNRRFRSWLPYRYIRAWRRNHGDLLLLTLAVIRRRMTGKKCESLKFKV